MSAAEQHARASEGPKGKGGKKGALDAGDELYVADQPASTAPEAPEVEGNTQLIFVDSPELLGGMDLSTLPMYYMVRTPSADGRIPRHRRITRHPAQDRAGLFS